MRSLVPTRYRKPLALAVFLVALGMVAVACGAEAPAGDCLAPEDVQLVPSDCELPGVTPDPTATPTPTTVGNNGGGDPAVALMSQYGCGACHTIAGTSLSGVVGPALSTIGAMHDADYIRQSIVDPNAVIAQGYSAGIMPQNFGTAIPQEDLDAIVEYLSGLQ
jgi:cytochrome c551/c552